MKKLPFLIGIAIVLLTLYSCKKDNEPDVIPIPNVTISNSDFLPDNNANSWIYEIYLVDSSGIETLLGNDTINVSDTIVSGKSYKKYNYKLFPSRRHHVELMRDSSGFMVNNFGRIVFTTNPLNTILGTDSIGNLFISSYEMINEPNCINVPAGTYCNVLNFRNLLEFDSRIADSIKPYKKVYNHKRYALNTGLIFHSYSYASVAHIKHFEKRLVSFTIVP